MKVTPTAAPLGAEIIGIQLSESLPTDVLRGLVAALHRHSVLVLRGQHLTDEEHLRFSHALGPSRPPQQQETANFQVPGMPELLRLSNIFVDGKAIGILEAGQYWHSDRSFEARPDGYAVLHALTVPRDATGRALGETLFVSAAHAWDTLDEATQRTVLGLNAVHDYNNPFSTHRFSETRRTRLRLEEEHYAPVVHPVVRAHPHTGRKSLYVNQHYTKSIVGWDESRGRALIDRLCAHMTRDEVVFAHRWLDGDIVIWDDVAIQHQAVGNYTLEQPRLVQRTTVDAIRPEFLLSDSGLKMSAR